jgi:hypothetical protein
MKTKSNVIKIKEKCVLLTNEDLIEISSSQGFQKLITAPREISLGGVARYWIGRFFDEFKKLVKDYEKARIETAERYCDKGEDGKPLMTTRTRMILQKDEFGQTIQCPVPVFGEDGAPQQAYSFQGEGSQDSFDQEFKELKDAEVSIPFQRIELKLSALGDYLNSQELAAIDKLVEWTDLPEAGK